MTSNTPRTPPYSNERIGGEPTLENQGRICYPVRPWSFHLVLLMVHKCKHYTVPITKQTIIHYLFFPQKK